MLKEAKMIISKLKAKGELLKNEEMSFEDYFMYNEEFEKRAQEIIDLYELNMHNK